jgi:hypothetical protein
MKIYNVLWEDRHTDTTATPFLDLDAAKVWAREQALESNNYPDCFIEKPIDGWLYYVEYSSEGDCLWITEHDV